MKAKRRLFDLGIAARAALSTARREPPRAGAIDILLAVVDHYEPSHGGATRQLARERVDDWLIRYRKIAGSFRDSDGRMPAHGFFYPWDEYDPWEMDRLVEFCSEGFGEIELHLHHKDDSESTLRAKLREGLQTFRRHGALSRWPDGRTAFAFIHGNWALDNSRIEGEKNFCGVNNELTVLQDEGCYADFTFPAWQNPAQPRTLNSIYYAVDDPAAPKSYDRGQPARAGAANPRGLLMVQGPLTPYIARRGRGLRLAMDDGDLAASRRYDPRRLDRWVRAGVHVDGRPDRIFIKLYCHGAPEKNRHVLLGADLEALFSDALTRFNRGRYRMHFVTAREMVNVVRATEAGVEGEINELRDWSLPSPQNAPVPVSSLSE